MFGWKAFDLNSISMEIQIAYDWFCQQKEVQKEKGENRQRKGGGGEEEVEGRELCRDTNNTIE